MVKTEIFDQVIQLMRSGRSYNVAVRKIVPNNIMSFRESLNDEQKNVIRALQLARRTGKLPSVDSHTHIIAKATMDKFYEMLPMRTSTSEAHALRKKLGVSPKTIKRYLAKLVAAGKLITTPKSRFHKFYIKTQIDDKASDI